MGEILSYFDDQTKQRKANIRANTKCSMSVSDVLLRLGSLNLTPSEKLILLYLTDCVNMKGSIEGSPTLDMIRSTLGVSHASIIRSLGTLKKQGLITLEKKKGVCGNYNVYSISNTIMTSNIPKKPKKSSCKPKVVKKSFISRVSDAFSVLLNNGYT